MFTAAKLWNKDGLLVRDGLWDRLAVLVSGLCLVHCVSTIAIVAILSSAGGILRSACSPSVAVFWIMAI